MSKQKLVEERGEEGRVRITVEKFESFPRAYMKEWRPNWYLSAPSQSLVTYSLTRGPEGTGALQKHANFRA